MSYYIAKFFISIYFHIIYRLRISGLENIPRHGGVIICSNHISYVDPIVLVAAVKRPIHFIAKKEIFKNRFNAFWLQKFHVFPVDRNATDMISYKTAIERLKLGNVLGIFAQGRRTSDFNAKDSKSGVALFALKTGVPIVPVRISSEYKWFSNVHIDFGEPISLEAYKGQKIKSELLDEITENIMEKINNL